MAVTAVLLTWYAKQSTTFRASCFYRHVSSPKKDEVVVVVSASFLQHQEQPKFLTCSMCIGSLFARVVDYRLGGVPYSCSMVYLSLPS